MYNFSETCDSLKSVKNGTVHLSTNGTTTVSTFTCQSGSSLNGSGTAACGGDGKWDVSSPVCGNLIKYFNKMFFSFFFLGTY